MPEISGDHLELSDDRLAGAFIFAACRALDGLLTAYYPNGMDFMTFGMTNPMRSVEALAKKIEGPVQLMIASVNFGNMSRIYFPHNVKAKTLSVAMFLRRMDIPEQGIWTHYHSLNEDRRLNTTEVDNDMLLSGVLRETPIYMMDVKLGMDVDAAKARMATLYEKTGQEIIYGFHDDIFHASALAAGSGVKPLRPEQYAEYRGVCDSFRYGPAAYFFRRELLESLTFA